MKCLLSAKYTIKALQKYKKAERQPIDLGKLPRNWIQLHMYKGKFYLYSPSNGPPRRIALNDSTMIVNEMERTLDLVNNVEQTGKYVYVRTKNKQQIEFKKYYQTNLSFLLLT